MPHRYFALRKLFALETESPLQRGTPSFRIRVSRLGIHDQGNVVSRVHLPTQSTLKYGGMSVFEKVTVRRIVQTRPFVTFTPLGTKVTNGRV